KEEKRLESRSSNLQKLQRIVQRELARRREFEFEFVILLFTCAAYGCGALGNSEKLEKTRETRGPTVLRCGRAARSASSSAAISPARDGAAAGLLICIFFRAVSRLFFGHFSASRSRTSRGPARAEWRPACAPTRAPALFAARGCAGAVSAMKFR